MNGVFSQDFRRGALFGAVLTAVLFVATGAGRPAGGGFVSGLLDRLATESRRALGRAPGPVLARVEGQEIRKSDFEGLYGAFAGSIEFPSDKKERLEHEKKLRRHFLDSLVVDRVFLLDFRTRAALQKKPAFLYYLRLKFHEAVREYFLLNHISSGVDTVVSDKEIGEMYDKLKAEPRYAQALSRMELAKVQGFIRKRIVQQRKVEAARKYLDRLKMRYRIETFENLL